MRKFKRIFGVVIAFVMVFSMAAFKGYEANAKNVPKYLKNDTEFICQAYMYGDKAIAITNDSRIFFDKKVKNCCLNNDFYPIRVSKKYVYATNYKEEILLNIEDGGRKDAVQTLVKMNKAVGEKYNIDLGFTIHDFMESDTDLLWARFMFIKDGKDIGGMVSSNGDIIELPIEDQEIYEIVIHNDKAYILYGKQGQYNINVYSPGNKEVNLCKIDGIFNKEMLQGLVLNKDDDMYIIYKGQPGLEQGENEISKINLKDGKGTLNTIAKYSYDYKNQYNQRNLVSVDNNKNIWYLQEGLIYKIENDKPVLKYEVQKNRSNLFVSDDNNLIVSGNEYEEGAPNNPYKTGNSTIINLSDKYENGWVKDLYGWTYYEDRQAVNNQWKNINSKWYYFGIYGEMITDWMNSDDGNLYYLNPEGDAAIGWKEVYYDCWYYFNDSGARVTGWVNTNGKWYYLDEEPQYPGQIGVMVKGWKQIEGKWYYLNDNGSMATGWKEISGVWYYFYNNGSMAHNTTIDGYKIGSNGAML